MKLLLFLLLLCVTTSIAQSNEKFRSDFLLEDELKAGNLIEQYNQYDFSNIWKQTENHLIFGIIGTDNQRIKIKLISIEKNSANPYEYYVYGKSNVKGNICDFTGVINLTEIKEFEQLHLGIDNEYKHSGIKSQGILIANYEFKENLNHEHSGIFNGKLYSKWYLDSVNQIKYDNTESISDLYMNNAFVGTWKSYPKGNEKICNWADYRVPNASEDFDIGAGEFSPSEKYYSKGWENYQKAWLYGNEEAKKEELEEWWH